MTSTHVVSELTSKRGRIKYTPEQVSLLEDVFSVNHYPDVECQERLASKLDVTTERVAIWFQNRRSKFKRQRQSDHVAWMRAQIFQCDGSGSSKFLFGTPILPALTSACHVLSPLESQMCRGDTLPCVPFSPVPNQTPNRRKRKRTNPSSGKENVPEVATTCSQTPQEADSWHDSCPSSTLPHADPIPLLTCLGGVNVCTERVPATPMAHNIHRDQLATGYIRQASVGSDTAIQHPARPTKPLTSVKSHTVHYRPPLPQSSSQLPTMMPPFYTEGNGIRLATPTNHQPPSEPVDHRLTTTPANMYNNTPIYHEPEMTSLHHYLTSLADVSTCTAYCPSPPSTPFRSHGTYDGSLQIKTRSPERQSPDRAENEALQQTLELLGHWFD